jgi:hypothetical protein
VLPQLITTQQQLSKMSTAFDGSKIILAGVGGRGAAAEMAARLPSESSRFVNPSSSKLHARICHPMSHLPLDDMHLRHYGLTQAIAANNREAAEVCLSRHHVPPTDFSVEHNGESTDATVNWSLPDARTLAAWNNAIDATTMGAYACVIAAVELRAGHLAVRRAETGTGADYYVGPSGSGVDDLENCYRLEVSGMDSGPESALRRRLAKKVEQVTNGNGNLPATAGVVGFEIRMILIADVGEVQ